MATAFWMGSCDHCGEHRQLSEFDQYALCAPCKEGHAADMMARTEMPSGCGTGRRWCEGTVNGRPCKAVAVAYGGWPGAGGWAGAYCQRHVDLMVPSGFQVWDRLEVAQ